ncbi:MAG: RHS repeat-associated core domain-containing protein, partial [Gemmatimonadaceae bacterium]
VERFSYNAAGRMRTAENGDAKVAREYYPGGLLATETQRIRPWADTDWEKHVYRLRYGYDLAGRKRWVEHPQQLVVQSWADSAAYGYDPATGALSTIDDVAGNVGFRFVYDLGGRLDSLVGGDLATAYTHDLEGRAVARMQALVASPTSPIHEDLLTYDARGKVLSADTRHEIVELRYSGLGHVARSGRVSRPGMTERKNERWVTDALGNQFTAQSSGFSGLPTLDDRRYGYERGPQGVGYGRQAATYEFNQLRDTSYYDAAGNVVRLTRVTSGSVEAVASYYGADGRLRTVDRRLCATWNNCLPPGWARGAYEDYRYDALGRRVLVRARHDTLCIGSTTCLSTIQRTVWDGDQVLYEIRRRGGQGQLYAELEEDTAATPVVYSCVGICPEPRDTVASGAEHYGRVGYTHGLAMDDPLAVARIGFHTGQTTLLTIVPQRNWRGHWDGGPNFLVIDWPARRYETFLRDRNSGGPPNWMGSLINLGRDASGLQYKRNRYYDPLMGRFTQEDPIGLAGGINLYGFADGDPVNFSDPFGLCPWWVSVFGGRSNCKQFDALRPAEQAWARRHPFKARTAARLRRAAEADAAGAAQLMKRYGGAGVHNGPGDALRHATWSCRLTQEFGSETARTITDNHETVSKDHPQDPKEARMDQHNNAVGRRLGASVQSGDQCVGAAIDADRNGELQTSLEP